jgi:hypothetical protein
MAKRRKNGLIRGVRLQIMLAPDELALVDDFRFRNRMPSRAAAVRELFRIGPMQSWRAPQPAGNRPITGSPSPSPVSEMSRRRI